MDNKAYIETGILESYALGMCNADEAMQVEKMCAQYPEIQTELTKIQESINEYALLHSKTPHTETREKILSKIMDNEIQTNISTTSIIPLFSNRLAIAASILLFSLSLIGNILLYTKYRLAKDEVITLNTEKQQLASNINANQVSMETMNKNMALLTHPNTIKVVMKGVEKSPTSMAMIYWNTQSKEVFIELKSLPMPEQGKQYQLWAIVDGKPVDAGIITMQDGDSSLHKMKDFESAQAFAITLENEGGSINPTLTQMYVMGAVGS